MSEGSFDPIVVTTTSDQKAVLERLAQQLVRDRLSACVQISGPITSCYRWQNKIETAAEWICVIKTSRHLFAELEKVVLRLHNYDEPQLIAVPIRTGSAGYLSWLQASLKSAPSSAP